MKYEVIEDHQCNNSKPIKVIKGEKVQLGRKSEIEDGWSNWIYCYSLKTSYEGWMPVQIIKTEGEYGTVLEDYSAKELNVGKNEMIHGEKELNGWLWCSRLNTLEEGWIPKDKVIEIKNDINVFESLK